MKIFKGDLLNRWLTIKQLVSSFFPLYNNNWSLFPKM